MNDISTIFQIKNRIQKPRSEFWYDFSNKLIGKISMTPYLENQKISIKKL